MIGVMSRATARAHANIALVKYWGKRDSELNLPAAGSLSLTLGALTTTATVELVDDAADSLSIDGNDVTGPALARLSAWMDIVRARAGSAARARVTSRSDFPTASGLASSASAYAALAVAASRAAGLDLSPRELSILARRGSGSAARSIFGGFVVMRTGQLADGTDSYAEPIAGVDDWPVRMVVAVVGGGRVKTLSSRAAMEHCAQTSPLYRGWLESVPGDLAAARSALSRRDIWTLGEVAERSALTMHASALAARPAIAYFQPATLACMHAVGVLRARDVAAFYTMDAGPHVKVLTLEPHVEQVSARLAEIDGVTKVIASAPGGPAVLAPS
jgi:diphosphomevalonate decarboxylase